MGLRFILVPHAKTGKIYQITTKYKNGKIIPNSRKWPYNIPTSSIAKSSTIYRNRDIWFEIMPSGNPGSRKYFKRNIST
jgi:hypothetical protein